MHKSDEEEETYFGRRLELFRIAQSRASSLSRSIGGRFVSQRLGWAQWIHLRLCIASDSILTLADCQSRIDQGEECTLDQSSLATLARGIVESTSMLFYMSDPVLNEEQWELRKLVLWLHDATTRYKMFSKWKVKDQAAGLREQMDKIRSKIESHAEFHNLPLARRNKIISGSEMYIHGLRSAVRLLDWDADDFDSLYAYLSSHTHSAPVSFMRLHEHGVDFKRPTASQRAIAGFALEVACNALELATARIESLFDNGFGD